MKMSFDDYNILHEISFVFLWVLWELFKVIHKNTAQKSKIQYKNKSYQMN